MNQKAIFCVVLSLFIAFSSCKDSDNEEEQLILPAQKIKTITYYSGKSIIHHESYEYDSSGRLSKLTYANSLQLTGAYDIYSYASDKIIVERYDDQETQFDTDTIRLNANGLVIYRRNSPYSNEYDGKGYLIKSKTVNGASVPTLITYQISNGNTIKMIKEEETVNKIVSTKNYTFLPNSVNTIGYENKGMPFYGNQDKNLIDEVHTTGSNWPEENYTYAYEYDIQIRVTKRETIGAIFSATETYTYYDN